MNFSCGKCGRAYFVPDEKVKGRSFKVKCRGCGQIVVVKPSGIVVNEPDLADPASAAPAPIERPAPQAPAPAPRKEPPRPTKREESVDFDKPPGKVGAAKPEPVKESPLTPSERSAAAVSNPAAEPAGRETPPAEGPKWRFKLPRFKLSLPRFKLSMPRLEFSLPRFNLLDILIAVTVINAIVLTLLLVYYLRKQRAPPPQERSVEAPPREASPPGQAPPAHAEGAPAPVAPKPPPDGATAAPGGQEPTPPVRAEATHADGSNPSPEVKPRLVKPPVVAVSPMEGAGLPKQAERTPKVSKVERRPTFEPEAEAKPRLHVRRIGPKEKNLLDLLKRKRDSAPSAPVEPLELDSTAPALDETQVAHIVEESRKAFDGCVSKALRRQPELRIQGRKIVVTFTIRSDGSVGSTSIDDAEVNGAELGRCIKAVYERIAFPAFEGDDIEVSAPLALSRGD